MNTNFYQDINAQVWGLMMAGRYEDALNLLNTAEISVLELPTEHLVRNDIAYLYLIRAVCLASFGELNEAFSVCQKGITNFPNSSFRLRKKLLKLSTQLQEQLNKT